MINSLDKYPLKVKRAEAINLINIEGLPHFIVATGEEDHYIERVALVLLDDDENSIGGKKIPNEDMDLDRILLLDPVSTDKSTVYQYPQQMMDTEKSGALVLLFVKSDAAIAIMQGGERRYKTKVQEIEQNKEQDVPICKNKDKQLVIEWLERAENTKEYLSAILK